MADGDKNATTLPNIRSARQNPQLDGLLESFGVEQQSNEILLNPNPSDQGQVIAHEAGQVRVVPTGYSEELRKNAKQRTSVLDYTARPSSILLFSWEGVPSKVPIAYEPGGTNPSISRYLRKRHCNGCSINGFITRSCPYCGSSDVISFYYQTYEQVPVKRNWYGETPCLCSESGEMSGACPRDGTTRDGRLTGFLSLQQMLMHATSKHPREYGIWQTLRQTTNTGGVDLSALRAEITAEVLATLQADVPAPTTGTPTVFTEACSACDTEFYGASLDEAEGLLLAHLETCGAGVKEVVASG